MAAFSSPCPQPPPQVAEPDGTAQLCPLSRRQTESRHAALLATSSLSETQGQFSHSNLFMSTQNDFISILLKCVSPVQGRVETSSSGF